MNIKICDNIVKVSFTFFEEREQSSYKDKNSSCYLYSICGVNEYGDIIKDYKNQEICSLENGFLTTDLNIGLMYVFEILNTEYYVRVTKDKTIEIKTSEEYFEEFVSKINNKKDSVE